MSKRRKKTQSKSQKESQKKKNGSRVTIAVRIRPKFGKDRGISVVEKRGDVLLSKEKKNLLGESENQIFRYNFDHVYSGSDQYCIFNDIGRKAVENCLAGFNSTVFAYGQTGSGKTYTMLGDIENSKTSVAGLFEHYKPLFHVLPVEIVNHIHSFVPEADLSNRGLIPRICENLFKRLREKYKYFDVSIRFFEIYNNKTRNLLDKKLKKFESHTIIGSGHDDDGVSIRNASFRSVRTYKELLGYLKHGLQNRITKSTKGNKVSSRSHACFTILIRTYHPKNRYFYRVRKMNLIDLAGSERHKTSDSKNRLKEGCFINTSLLELGRCLGIASKKNNSKKKEFIPVRTNLLTHILADCLGGQSKTFILNNVSPATKDANESFCTLEYAKRCKKIKLKLKHSTIKDWSKKLKKKLELACALTKKKNRYLVKFRKMKIDYKRTVDYRLYRSVLKQISLLNKKIFSFLEKKLEKFGKEVVNNALLESLIELAAFFEEEELRKVMEFINIKFGNNFFDYGELSFLVH